MASNGVGTPVNAESMVSTRSHANPNEDPNSPYYIASNDSLGVLAIAKTFTSDNCTPWYNFVIMTFTVKNKVGLLDGRINVPSSNDAILFNS